MIEPRRQEFADKMLEAALNTASVKNTFNPIIGAAMACHETGFGSSMPKDSNNVLGIKAGLSWQGPSVNAKTHEYTAAGVKYNTAANWRVYPSVEACFADYAEMIGRLWWYADAVANKGDPRKFLDALRPIYGPKGEVTEPGYFTDPRYALKLWNIVETYYSDSLIDSYFPPTPEKIGLTLFVSLRDEPATHTLEIPAGLEPVLRVTPTKVYLVFKEPV